jgi:hypothetical protein
MSEFKSHNIKRRIFSHEDLSADTSIQSIGFWDLQNWNDTCDWYKSAKRFPLSRLNVSDIRDAILRPSYFAVYELENPLIIIYRWPNGELRYFLLSAEGNLIEPQEASLWDSAFPFLSCGSYRGNIVELAVPRSCDTVDVDNWIWYPNHANYTHFFFDAFVQVAMAQECLGNEYINKFFLPLLVYPPTWQNELLVRLSSQKYLYPTSMPHQLFQVFRVNKLLLPVLSHRAIALEWLRSYLALSFKTTDPLDLFTAQNSIIMATRYDSRRRRITNISEIENFILSLGGKLLDPSTLSIAEKLTAFQHCRFCIAESSGCINFALFSPRHSHLIALTDPTVVDRKEFIFGGWDYTTGYAHNTSFVVGEDPAPLLGSPLGSATYSLSIIRKILAKSTL